MPLSGCQPVLERLQRQKFRASFAPALPRGAGKYLNAATRAAVAVRLADIGIDHAHSCLDRWRHPAQPRPPLRLHLSEYASAEPFRAEQFVLVAEEYAADNGGGMFTVAHFDSLVSGNKKSA